MIDNYSDNEKIYEDTKELNKEKKVNYKEGNTNIIDIVSLSSKSKKLLILRILILSLCVLFFPMETIIEKKLESFEKKILVAKINNLLNGTFFKEKYFEIFSYYCFEIFGGKDSIIIYVSIVYFLFHPFIALKLVFVTNIIYYGIIILQMLFKSYRPLWESTQFYFCNTNYGNPSINYFFDSFFFLYILISFRLVDQKKRLNFSQKILILIFYCCFIIQYGITSIINQIHYIYQLIFTLCISLILICLMIDFDTIIHNFIFKALKNVYKSRQYKMKIFFYILGMTIISALLLFFIEDNNLNEIKANLKISKKCDLFDLENIGTKSSFLEIDFIFGIIGAFWGASFTLENNIEKWWDDNIGYSILKITCAIILNIILILLHKPFTSLSFEIFFLFQCFTYFIRTYLIFGILPFIFDKFRKKSKNNEGINLFKTSIFSQGENEDNEYLVIDYLKNEKMKLENNKKKIIKSTLIENVEKHLNEDGLEFYLSEENGEIYQKSDNNISLFSDELNEN